ncbi:MAG: folylpolyglutamate synthase/dihydrofolate synthase [Chthonomonadaceae bacterium]|nr:folylpolyglutamate synthase/dihydrofolate synthase [Chthonomonadaceae bacterium]
MEFEEALHYMEGLIRFGWKLGNERFEALCARLGNPQERYAIVHVAGTKGKGSTTALTAAILQHSGYRVGSYFSPYVFDVRERVQVNGAMIPHADFARLVTLARPHIEALAQTDLGQTTEFELKTLIGFLYFAEQNVDYACIEVGIGGRLDATNLVKPTVTIITNIGLDHTQILGETHALIAAEKAGILKSGVPCFTAADNDEALAVIARIAAERSVPLTQITQSDAEEPTHDPMQVHWDLEEATDDSLSPHQSKFRVATPEHLYTDLTLRMHGLYQRFNASCAVAAAESALHTDGQTLSIHAVRAALAETILPGRMQEITLRSGTRLILDGAHNGIAAAALHGPITALRAQYGIERLLLVVGMVGGHDPAEVLAPFAPEAAQIYVCQPDWKRALPAEEIAATALRFTPNVTVIPNVAEAVQAAIDAASPNDLILVTGSFYTVGEVPVAALDRVT